MVMCLYNSDLFPNFTTMKTFRERFSVTKLVFIIVIVSLCIFTGYYVFADLEDKSGVVVAFLSIAMTITNFYFKDKNSKEFPDSLIEEEKSDDLHSNQI
jgi:hypothetical protein